MGGDLQKSFEVEQELIAILPILVLPISICSLFFTAKSAFNNKNYIQMMPLIFTQIITIYIWSCIASVQIGFYRLVVSGQPQIHGTVFRIVTIRYLISNTSQLDPVSVFLYTWQLLPTLKIEEENIFLV